MTANDLLDIIGDVDDNIIEEAQESRETNNIRWGISIAACFCLVIGSITTVVATGFGTKLIDFFTAREITSDYKESGYDLSVAIERIREDNFSTEIQNVGNTIRQQFQESSPLDNWYPGEWQTDFESRNQACEYVGLNQIKTFANDWKEDSTTLRVTGTEQGKIQEISIETNYNVDDICMQLFTQMYTSNYEDSITLGIRTTEDMNVTESYFTTDSNTTCHVIHSSALESGYLSIDGYIVSNGILYNLHIPYLEKDSSQAEALLHQWAEML